MRQHVVLAMTLSQIVQFTFSSLSVIVRTFTQIILTFIHRLCEVLAPIQVSAIMLTR